MGLFALIPACGQTELEPPELTAVEPDTITTRGGEVRVLGRHLWVEPRVDLGSSDPPSLDRNWAVLIDEQRLPTDAVVWIDTVTLEATIPSGLLPGLKDVVAISPSGLKAVLPDGLTVLDETEATLRIEDAPGGTGQAVGDVTLSVGGQLVLYAVGRNGTELTDVDAQWTIDGSAGTISPELGPDTVFEAVAAGTAVVTAHHLLYGTDSTGTITVESCSTGGWYLDADGDGHGDPAAPYSGAECPPPSGYVEDDADCDDDPDGCGADCHPGAPELCDGLDNDCDGRSLRRT
jgi:hypothetical protein